jgi:hypothetical protein
MTDNAREVIAADLVETWRNADKIKVTKGTLWCLPEDMHKNLVPGGFLYEKFEVILAALRDAGYDVVKRDAEPSDAQIDAAAVAMYFRRAMPVSQESIDRFKGSDAWPVWREQALAGLTAANCERGGSIAR